MFLAQNNNFYINQDALSKLNAPVKIAIVRSRFNQKITQLSFDACNTQLLNYGLTSDQITEIAVPGALEIGYALKTFALKKPSFDALIAIGCIIRGETYHFDLVANESASSITRISLDHHIPIINAILTVESKEQAWERAKIKGSEAAHGAIEMALFKRLNLNQDQTATL